MAVKYSIEKEVGEVGKANGATVKRLRLVSWSDAPAKIDLRLWITNKNGEEVPGRGITLTNEEAEDVLRLLSVCIGKEG